MNRLSLIIICSLYINNCVQAFDGWIDNYKASIFFGTRYLSVDSLSSSGQLDFANYIENQTGGLESFYVGFSLDLSFKNNWESEISLILQDGIGLSNYAVSLHYFPQKYVGINAGIYGYGYFIEEFDYPFLLKNPELITFDDDNYFQLVGRDFGVIAGPVIQYSKGQFHSRLFMNMGTITTCSFSQTFIQKETNSNYRRILIYETKPTWSFFVFPEIRLSYDLVNNENFQMGVQLNSNFLLQNKQIDYNLHSMEWTENEEVQLLVRNPKHLVKKVETSAGIYFKW